MAFCQKCNALNPPISVCKACGASLLQSKETLKEEILDNAAEKNSISQELVRYLLHIPGISADLTAISRISRVSVDEIATQYIKVMSGRDNNFFEVPVTIKIATASSVGEYSIIKPQHPALAHFAYLNYLADRYAAADRPISAHVLCINSNCNSSRHFITPMHISSNIINRCRERRAHGFGESPFQNYLVHRISLESITQELFEQRIFGAFESNNRTAHIVEALEKKVGSQSEVVKLYLNALNNQNFVEGNLLTHLGRLVKVVFDPIMLLGRQSTRTGHKVSGEDILSVNYGDDAVTFYLRPAYRLSAKSFKPMTNSPSDCMRQYVLVPSDFAGLRREFGLV